MLKVHINILKHNQELIIYKHLSKLNLDHAGREHVREVWDTFKMRGPHGEHEVFVMSPLGMSLCTLQELQKDRVFQQTLVTSALDQTLLGLNYLHDADVIHTGNVHPNYNIIQLTVQTFTQTIFLLHLPTIRSSLLWRKMSFTGPQHESLSTIRSFTSRSICWEVLGLSQSAISDRHASARCTGATQCRYHIVLLKSFSA